MYKVFTEIFMGGIEVEQVFYEKEDGSVVCFQNVESNLGQDRVTYLEWLEQGNTPEPWSPDGN